MARDWTLSARDRKELGTYRTTFRLFLAVQLCAVRLYGRFLNSVHDLSPRILNYLGSQLGLPSSLTIEVPERKATYTEHRKNLLDYLGFQKFDERGQSQLTTWLKQQAQQGLLPEPLFQQAEQYLLARRILLPGPSVLERPSSISVPTSMNSCLRRCCNVSHPRSDKLLTSCSRCPRANNTRTFTD
jgi:hypothetical protein